MQNNKLCFNLLSFFKRIFLLSFFKRIFSYKIKNSALKTQRTVRISYHNWYRLTFVVACLAAFLCLLLCQTVVSNSVDW